MQQYLFRGKRKDNGEWETGCLVSTSPDEAFILIGVTGHIKRDDYECYMVEVRPETVGIWIGWLDWLGAKVFTGDKILIAWDHGEESVETISYSEEYGYFMYGNNPICELKDPERIFTVVGNIHDVNPAAKEQL